MRHEAEAALLAVGERAVQAGCGSPAHLDFLARAASQASRSARE